MKSTESPLPAHPRPFVRWAIGWSEYEEPIDGLTVLASDIVATTADSVASIKLTSGDRRWTIPLDPYLGAGSIGLISCGTSGALIVPTWDNGIVAVDAESGNELWRNHNPRDVTWVHCGLLVYAANDAGLIVALNPTNGSVAWSKRIWGHLEEYRPVKPLLASNDSRVFLAVPSPPADLRWHTLSSHGPGLIAVSGSSGGHVWSMQLRDAPKRPRIVAADDLVLFQPHRTTLLAVDSESGALAWSYSDPAGFLLETGVSTSNVVLQTLDAVNRDEEIILDRDTGQQIQRFRLGFHYNLIFVRDGRAYYYDQNSYLYRVFDVTNRQELWVCAPRYQSSYELLEVTEDYVVLSENSYTTNDERYQLTILDVQSGEVVWSLAFNSGVKTVVAVMAGFLILTESELMLVSLA